MKMQQNAFVSPCQWASIALVAIAASIPLAGCSIERFGADDSAPTAASAASGNLAPVSLPRGGPPIEMTGHWVLASTGSGSCGMIFNSVVGAREGTVAPEGGCKGKFVTSRKWAFEQNSLIISNYNGEPLAQLSSAEPGRLEGRATNGEPVSLTR
ncbi:MAG: AprI/Inh family metalloprotease inhibitor [Bradyrhizobiaceae bacterium]|nr:AprI/Inh family metalloprotease inhibitor [Bradyrhizobiaceae bacterium]